MKNTMKLMVVGAMMMGGTVLAAETPAKAPAKAMKAPSTNTKELPNSNGSMGTTTPGTNTKEMPAPGGNTKEMPGNTKEMPAPGGNTKEMPAPGHTKGSKNHKG